MEQFIHIRSRHSLFPGLAIKNRELFSESMKEEKKLHKVKILEMRVHGLSSKSQWAYLVNAGQKTHSNHIRKKG